MALDAAISPASQARERLYPFSRLRPGLRRLVDAVTIRHLFAFLLLVNIVASSYWVLDRQQGLQDLGSFLHSGAAHREGLDPYEYYPGIQPQPISPDALNLNPPVSVYLFETLSRVDPFLLRHGLLAATALMFALGVFLLTCAYPDKRDPVVLLAVFSLAGLWHIFGYLQLYAPLFLAAVGAWLLMRRGNSLGAAVLIGLIVVVKPNFVLWPLFLLVAGYPRVALPALAAAAGISAIPLVLDGPGIYQQWLSLSMSFDGLQWASNASLMSIGARFGLPTFGYLASVAVVLAMLAMQLRLRPSLLDSSTFGIIAALLFGPASWAGYTLFLLPTFFSRRWSSKLWASFLLLCTPFWVVHYLTGFDPITNAIVGPVYGWAVLLLLAVMVARQLSISAQLRGLGSGMAVLIPQAVSQLSRERGPAA